MIASQRCIFFTLFFFFGSVFSNAVAARPTQNRSSRALTALPMNERCAALELLAQQVLDFKEWTPNFKRYIKNGRVRFIVFLDYEENKLLGDSEICAPTNFRLLRTSSTVEILYSGPETRDRKWPYLMLFLDSSRSQPKKNRFVFTWSQNTGYSGNDPKKNDKDPYIRMSHVFFATPAPELEIEMVRRNNRFEILESKVHLMRRSISIE